MHLHRHFSERGDGTMRRHLASDCSELLGTVCSSWFAPFYIMLLNMFQCHFTGCSGILVVSEIRCLLEKICNRSERVTITWVRRQHRCSQIKSFEEARYVPAPGTVWRMFQFGMNRLYLTAVGLQNIPKIYHRAYLRVINEKSAVNCRNPGTKSTDQLTANKI